MLFNFEIQSTFINHLKIYNMQTNNQLATSSGNGVKSKAGMAVGFILGVSGFLFLFKIIILDKTSPEDELAPGIVVLAALLNGVLFAFIARAIQRRLERKATS